MAVNLQNDFPECKPFGHFAKRAIVELIRQQDDPEERAEWQRVALKSGAISQSDLDGE